MHNTVPGPFTAPLRRFRRQDKPKERVKKVTTDKLNYHQAFANPKVLAWLFLLLR